jgi:sugar transferase (PEP-CTERM/EpsH1 system associated)
MRADERPLIAHVLHRFDTGGLENGVVNLVNRLPADRFRHAIVALTEVTAFSRRIERDDVELVSLRKPPGQGIWVFPRMLDVLRRLRPAVVHTRNLAALEMSVPAAWAGVPVRVHGEHGWDEADPAGANRKFRLIRSVYRPFVHHYVALSRQLERYVVDRVGVAAERVDRIYNGVDLHRFQPASGARAPIEGSPFAAADLWVVGTVGRLQAVKNQTLLAQAFARALQLAPHARERLRLAIVGDGPERPAVEAAVRAGGIGDVTWFAGARSDVPAVLRGLDAFALPSIAEGISNTILEAMASGLPIVATDVGGNAELLADRRTGRLVPSEDVDAMAAAQLDDFAQPEAARARGRAARADAEARFGLDRMDDAYGDLYERLLRAAARRGAPVPRLT